MESQKKAKLPNLSLPLCLALVICEHWQGLTEKFSSESGYWNDWQFEYRAKEHGFSKDMEVQWVKIKGINKNKGLTSFYLRKSYILIRETIFEVVCKL